MALKILKVITHMEVDRSLSVDLVRYIVTQSSCQGMAAYRHAAAIRLREMAGEP